MRIRVDNVVQLPVPSRRHCCLHAGRLAHRIAALQTLESRLTKRSVAAAACGLCLQVPAQVPVRTFVESYFGFKHSFFVSDAA